jgi:4-hydroxybenzoate polyprenyltransferase
VSSQASRTGFAGEGALVGALIDLSAMLARIRAGEALIFMTPTVMGLVMFVPALAPGYALDALLACAGSFFLAASILAVNDWADIRLDTQNALKRKRTFLEMGIGPRQMLGLTIGLGAAGLLLFAALSRLHALAALGALALGAAYSVPVGAVRGKSLPVLSSLLHFGGTLLAFLLGALTFAPDDWRGLLAAAHPAILITAGHLVHEVEDYEQDRLSGCRTHAVRFGPKPVFGAASLLFAASFALLYWLAAHGFLPAPVQAAALLAPVYAVFAVRAYRSGLTRDGIRRLRHQYRALFAAVTLSMLAGSLPVL